MNDAACMFSLFSQAIEHVGSQNVVQIVTKNTNAYIAAGAMIEKKYPHVYWSPCAVHCSDLLLEDIGKLKWIWPTIRKAQYISKFIYAHGLTHEFMRMHTENEELAKPGATKSRSPTVELLQLVYSTKGSIRHVYHCMTLARSVIQAVLNSEGFPGRAKQIDELITKIWDQMASTNLYAAAHILNPEHGYGQMIQIDADVKLRTAMYKVLERILRGQPETQVMIIEELYKYKTPDAFDFGDAVVFSESRMAAEKIRPVKYLWSNMHCCKFMDT